MKWTWVGRIFSGAKPEPDPSWLDRRTHLDREVLLMSLVDALGGRHRVAAAERIREVAGGMRMAEWVRVDEALRRLLSWHYHHGTPTWMRAPDDVRRLPLPPGTEVAVLGMIAMAPDGHVREAAVQRLALLGSGDELPPLLIRANDWVLPVRARALDALHARVVPGYAAHWVRALPLVLRLRGTERGEGGPLVDAVLALLRAPESRNEVWKGMHSADTALRRACFRILREAGRSGLRRLLGDALGSPDETIRREAAQAAAALDDGALEELLPRMLADPFPGVRRAGLALAAGRRGRAALPALRDALLDRATGIRSDARAAIEPLEPMDFAAFYRARIQPDAPRLAEALAGLGETGGAGDANVVAPLLDHARVRVRAGAVRALARLAGDAALPALTGALGDPSPAVSRAAGDALRSRVRLADAGALAAWFGAGNAQHVRRNALALLAARGKWDGLAWILHARADAHPAVRSAAAEQVNRWRGGFNRSFSQPTPAQHERIRAALAGSAGGMDAKTAEWLRFAAGIGA